MMHYIYIYIGCIEHLHTHFAWKIAQNSGLLGVYDVCFLRNSGQTFLEIYNQENMREDMKVDEVMLRKTQLFIHLTASDIHEIIYTDHLKNHPASANKHNLTLNRKRITVETKPLGTLWCFHCTFSEQNFNKSTLTEKKCFHYFNSSKLFNQNLIYWPSVGYTHTHRKIPYLIWTQDTHFIIIYADTHTVHNSLYNYIYMMLFICMGKIGQWGCNKKNNLNLFF